MKTTRRCRVDRGSVTAASTVKAAADGTAVRNPAAAVRNPTTTAMRHASACMTTTATTAVTTATTTMSACRDDDARHQGHDTYHQELLPHSHDVPFRVTGSARRCWLIREPYCDSRGRMTFVRAFYWKEFSQIRGAIAGQQLHKAERLPTAARFSMKRCSRTSPECGRAGIRPAFWRNAATTKTLRQSLAEYKRPWPKKFSATIETHNDRERIGPHRQRIVCGSRAAKQSSQSFPKRELRGRELPVRHAMMSSMTRAPPTPVSL